MTERLRVPIDRTTWVNGRYGVISERMGESALLNPEECQCCLGKLGTVLGISDRDLSSVGLPSSVNKNVLERWPQILFDRTDAMLTRRTGKMEECRWQIVFAEINDAEDVPDAIREAWIAEGFRTVLDCEADFFGEYPEVT